MSSISFPWKGIVPSVGANFLVINPANTDLPQPGKPTKPNDSPFSTLRLTLDTIEASLMVHTLPNGLIRFLSETTLVRFLVYLLIIIGSLSPSAIMPPFQSFFIFSTSHKATITD